MAVTPYLRDLILDAALSGERYASLHDSDPYPDGGGELSGSGYGRQRLAYGPAVDGSKTITTDLLFKNLPKRSGIGWVGIWDAKDGGKFLWPLPLMEAQDTNPGSSLLIEAGSLTNTAK